MAYAMMGGIGTVLSLLFQPALYVAWFRIPAAQQDSARALDIEPARGQISS